jgi:endonuclease/exonuclease/phosphatase family metal-dependent hydrolase
MMVARAVALTLVLACQEVSSEDVPPAAASGAAGSTAASAGAAGVSVQGGSSGGQPVPVAGSGGVTGNAGSGGGGSSAGTGAGGGQPNDHAAVKVLTFNVRTQEADPVDAPLGNDWVKRLPLALEVLSAQAPDVVGLQEATDAQVEALKGSFALLGAPGVSILYDASRLTPLEGAVVGVGNYGNMDPWGERYCNWQRFKLEGTSSEFVFFNTHLSTAGDNVPQAEFVLEMAATWAEQGLPSVVVGDFNYDASATIAAHGFVDGLSDHAGTFHGFAGGRSGPRLDFIALAGASAQGSGVDTRSDDAADPTVYPSDHYPVWGLLEL